MVGLTVIHTVVGALFFAAAVVAVLLCYRLVPRETGEIFVRVGEESRGEVAA
jgi:hypothetical protein